MNCEQCNCHLSALIDGELSATVQREVQRHLDKCRSCRDALDDLKMLDAKLTDQLALSSNAIDRAVDASTTPLGPQPSLARARWIEQIPAWSIVAVVAASIALAFVLLPRKDDPLPGTALPTAGRLVSTTGSVEVLDPESQRWQPFVSSNELFIGSRIRTPVGVNCEIEMADRATLRLGGAAELAIRSPKHIEVLQGQVWCRTSESEPLRVDARTPNSQLASSMICPANSEFQWTIDSNRAVVQALAGPATEWTGTDFRCPVGPGERIAVDNQQNVERSEEDLASTKIWQLPLLAVSGKGQEELDRVIEAALIRIGRTKTGYLDEQQIRQLGPRGAIPLLAYVQSDRSGAQVSVRHRAMQIATELADESASSRLRQLSSDQDDTIAEHAKRALQRIENNVQP